MVEAALTLPLVVFLILGTLQLFLLLQARIESEYAVFRATRAGSVTQGKCQRMRHAAIAALLPTFARTTNPLQLAAAFALRRNNRFDANWDSGHNRSIVWITRERPTLNDFQTRSNGPDADDARFDDQDRPLRRLEVRMIFWYPMRIPFANWVMGHMFLAHFGLQQWRNADPTMLFKKDGSDWNARQSIFLEAQVGAEMRRRVNAKQYAFPIASTYSMRMMTPARRQYFDGSDPWCLN